MDPLLIGIPGMTLILIAFILGEFHKLSVDSKSSILMNLGGSGLLTIYAYTLNSIPFIILNVIWFISAMYKLFNTTNIKK